MAGERTITNDIAFVFGIYLVISLVESAWYMRNAFSVAKLLWDWLPNVISLACTYVLLLFVEWRQNRPDKYFIGLKLSGDSSDSGINEQGKVL